MDQAQSSILDSPNIISRLCCHLINIDYAGHLGYDGSYEGSSHDLTKTYNKMDMGGHECQ